jgi:hypothetical protein
MTLSFSDSHRLRTADAYMRALVQAVVSAAT